MVGHKIGSMSSISVMSTAHSSGSRCRCHQNDDSGGRCATCSGQTKGQAQAKRLRRGAVGTLVERARTFVERARL